MKSPRALPPWIARWARAWPNVLLGVAAACGLIAFAGVLALNMLGMRIALVDSASMEPAIPAGSAALVRSVGAHEVSVGDVVTVDRDRTLPVIHRVVGIGDPPHAAPEARDLRLRGDANPVDDPGPYRVERVGLVVMSAPGAAPVIHVLRSPWAIGGLLIVTGTAAVAAYRSRRAGRSGDRDRLSRDRECTNPAKSDPADY